MVLLSNYLEIHHGAIRPCFFPVVTAKPSNPVGLLESHEMFLAEMPCLPRMSQGIGMEYLDFHGNERSTLAPGPFIINGASIMEIQS